MIRPFARNYAPGAAALGVLSNRDMVDLYAQVADDSDAPDAASTRAEALAVRPIPLSGDASQDCRDEGSLGRCYKRGRLSCDAGSDRAGGGFDPALIGPYGLMRTG